MPPFAVLLGKQSLTSPASYLARGSFSLQTIVYRAGDRGSSGGVAGPTVVVSEVTHRRQDAINASPYLSISLRDAHPFSWQDAMLHYSHVGGCGRWCEPFFRFF